MRGTESMNLLTAILISSPLFAGPCALALPGEGYESTGCGHFGDAPVLGEWAPNPSDFVFVDSTCIENEQYFVAGLAEFNHFDGAPPCSVAPTIAIDDPPATPLTPAIVTDVAEPGSVGLVLLGLIAGVAMLLRSKGRL